MAALPVRQNERLYTADEFETLPEFDDNYELVEGRLVRKLLPNVEHSLIAHILMKQYMIFDSESKAGQVLQEVSTRLNSLNTPAPDVAFWKAERKPKRRHSA